MGRVKELYIEAVEDLSKTLEREPTESEIQDWFLEYVDMMEEQANVLERQAAREDELAEMRSFKNQLIEVLKFLKAKYIGGL